MTDRPAILSAKLNRLVEIIADADDLKARSQADRPAQADLNAVRESYRDAVQEVQGAKGSVAEAKGVSLPSERLGGD